MNKLMGFFELKSTGLPAVPWEEFTPETCLDDAVLWTVRVAVDSGGDLNLPRAVGVPAAEAMQKGREFLRVYASHGMVIYYPYFIADKSGVLSVETDRTIIEAVEKDLWNLVTHGRKDITLIISGDKQEIHGNSTFLTEEETAGLWKYAAILRGRYRDELCEGQSVLAEWSYAYRSDKGGFPVGSKFLVFYELRSV